MARTASPMRSFNSIRRDYALSDDQIRAVAPSIFAVEPHVSRSERYAYIPTSAVLEKLRVEGFQPFMVAQSRTRSVDRREFTRHMIRMRHASNITSSEAAHEIVLLNSHDGTSSYQILSGMFRFVCANGMVCGDVEQDIRIRHKGNITDDVLNGMFTVLGQQNKLDQDIDAMRTIELSLPEQMILADEAINLRFGDAGRITTDQALTARRFDDRGNSLWNTFNRVQENLIRGGMDGRTATGKVRAVRAVTGMDQDTKLNRALWSLSQRMAELKA